HGDRVANGAHRLDAEVVALRRRIDDEIGQLRDELQREALIADARRAAPAFEAVIEIEMREIGVDARLRDLSRRQLRRIRLPSAGELDVQATARPLDEIRMPAEAGRLLDRSGVRE